MLNSLVIGLAAITGVSAQYRTRAIYSDVYCSELIAIKSEPIELEGEDDSQWMSDDSNCDSRESCAYMQCMEELQDEKYNEANYYGVYNCEYVEEEEGFEGVVTYAKEGCSYELGTVAADDKVLVATYEEGCPGVRFNDEGEDEAKLKEYLSMPQQCYPFAIKDAGQDKEGEEDNYYYQAQEKYSYYSIQCDANNALTTMQCRNSNCTDCVLTTTYIEDQCYQMSLPGGEEDHHDDNHRRALAHEEERGRFYAKYWCNTTTQYAYEEENDEEEDDEVTMMEIPKSAVIAVATVGGALILGMGGALVYQSMDSTDETQPVDQGNLQGNPDYQRLAN